MEGERNQDAVGSPSKRASKTIGSHNKQILTTRDLKGQRERKTFFFFNFRPDEDTCDRDTIKSTNNSILSRTRPSAA